MGYYNDFIGAIKLYEGKLEEGEEREKIESMLQSSASVGVAQQLLQGKGLECNDAILKGLAYWLGVENYSKFILDDNILFFHGSVKGFHQWPEWNNFIELLQEDIDYDWFGIVSMGERLDDIDSWGSPNDYELYVIQYISNPLGI